MDQRIDAIRSLWRAGALGLDDAEYHLTLGRAYHGIHQFVLFRSEMQIASQRQPKDPRPLLQIGQYLESIVNDYTEALRYYRLARMVDTPSETLLLVKAMVDELLRYDPNYRIILEEPLDPESYPEAEFIRAGNSEHDRVAVSAMMKA